MASIGLVSATFSYGAKTLFENVNFTINPNDRIGLVGYNGSGKTTFLRSLMGLEELNSGKRIGGKVKVGYLEQQVPPRLEDLTFYEALEEAIPEEDRSWSGYKVDMSLEGLGAPQDIWFLPLKNLSGGWRRLALIARTIMSDPDILILDEPTNDLDLQKILKFEKWLEEQTYPYIVVSHDRAFLDRCTNRTAFLRNGALTVYDLPYSQAMGQLYEDDLTKAYQRKLEEEEVDRIRRSAKRLKQWSRGINDRTERKIKSMMKRADKLESNLTVVNRDAHRALELRDSGSNTNKPLIRVKNLNVVRPDGELLFRVEKLDILPGDRVAILGKNGTGKTHFIRALANAYGRASTPDSTIIFQPQVKMGYIDQAQDNLISNPKFTLDQAVSEKFRLSDMQITRELVHAGFPIYEHKFKVENLSVGQRTRLGFLVLKLLAPNLFLLDEPTNHLDIEGQDQLEDEIIEKNSTAIFVSHDRAFIGSLANRYLVIDADKKRLTEVGSPQDFYGSLK